MSLSESEKNKAINLSEKLAKDFEAQRAESFSEDHKDKEWYEDFMTLLHMITDSEFSLSPGTWATIAGALAYVVFPVDILPDFIPIVGWIDDIFVLGWVMKVLADEIAAYKEFCKNRVRPKVLAIN